MAHFAQLDENNVVIQVLVVGNDDVNNLPFPDSEPLGQTFLAKLFPEIPANAWRQTSYNHNFRFRYAGIGFTFHPECGERGGFAAPPITANLVFDVDTCSWIPPVPYPNDGNEYWWDYEKNFWVKRVSTIVIG